MFTFEQVINDIIISTKIFNGDIFGSVIRDYRIANKLSINNIDIRLDSLFINPFLTLLNMKYKVIPILPCKIYNGISINTYKLLPIIPNMFFNYLFINIVGLSYKMFRISFNDFDCNLLAENDSSLYIRNIPYSLKHVGNKLDFIKNRILLKSFCCLDSIQGERSIKDLIPIIDNAHKMTQQDWIMDDYLQIKDTWLVGYWEGFLNGKHKTRLTLEKYNQLHSCNNCSLCHEPFKLSDIIINTACNHNFHWKCNSANGLRYWVNEHNKSTCPYCRSEMF